MIHVSIRGLVLGYSLLVLCLTPLAGLANSPSSQDASFTPVREDEPFAETLQRCVNRRPTGSIHLLSGLGGDSYPLVTLGPATDRVKAFYSQGMTLQYGFNFPAAIHAFYRAATVDEHAAMPYWGIALSASSNINSEATNGCNRLAYRAARLALLRVLQRQRDPGAQARYAPGQLQREVDYGRAFLTLFRQAGPGAIGVGDETRRSYAQAMEALSAAYPDDPDAATLYAAALLNVTPWKWWSGNAATSDRVAPTPEAERALQVLNRVLVQNPLHVGANHFYIHAIEESPNSASGLPMADRFRDLVPASGHLVHMASHVYQRTGDNALASATNQAAVAVDRAYAGHTGITDTYPLHYLGHNIHFLTWTLSIEGRMNESLAMADELVANTTRYATDAYMCTNYPEEITIKSDYFFAVPYYFAVRFQAWDYLDQVAGRVNQGLRDINEACSEATRDGATPWAPLTGSYSNAMLAYANAYRRLSQAALDTPAAIDVLQSYWTVVRAALDAQGSLSYGNNQAVDLFRVANLILINRAQESTRHSLSLDHLRLASREALEASAARPLSDDVQALRGTNGEQVIAAWQKAVAVQDALAYNEPPDWYYTLRESLGYAYLAQGQYEDAERAFREDLADNRLSGRSLFGLRRSLEHQPGKTVPSWLEQQFATAWRNATVSPGP
jgi:tetratricopeptide (TPR) repeat protein